MPSPELPLDAHRGRSPAWMWMFCGVLLCATFVNYANRVAFTQNAAPIIRAFHTDEDGYGAAEAKFNLGFATGLLLFGFLADRLSVRLLYPCVVLAWSLAGMSAGWVSDLTGLGLGRFLLGFFEAGHWPCALRTTQRIFQPAQRTWGNSILQSGAAVGQIATPLLVARLHAWNPEAWRWSFYAAGLLGLPWAVWWLLTVSERDLRQPVVRTDESRSPASGRSRASGEPDQDEPPLWHMFFMRRWWVLLGIGLCINTAWHYVRVWMPLTLEKERGYAHEFVGDFTALFYLMTFVGSLATGWLTSWLPHQGWPVHRARLAVFALCALLSAAAIPSAFVPGGLAVLGCLLVVGLGSLGLFPIYYSLSQDISAKYQGQVGSSLGFCFWTTMAGVHVVVGWLVKTYPTTRPYLLAATGAAPLLAWIVLAIGWNRRGSPATS